MIINNFNDILQAMERDPALREAMRRHILTEELLQLPAQVARLETSVAQLQEGQSRLETRMDNLEVGQDELKASQEELKASQEELKGRMDSMAGRLGQIFGSDYEVRSLRVAPRRLRQIMGISNATMILAAWQTPQQDILSILDQAITSNRISEDEAEDLDLALSGQDPSGNTVQVAIEASITISDEEIRRAIRRAEILERATRVPSRPAVIGENISPEVQAEDLGVPFLHLPARRE